MKTSIHDSGVPDKTCGKCAAVFSGRRCKPCRNEYMRAWNKKNPEKVKVAALAYGVANREKVRARAEAWYKANPERAKESRRLWQLANPEKARESARKHNELNRDAIREKSRARGVASRAANPDMHRLYVINRRARLRENGGVLSVGLAKRLMGLQKERCACCRSSLTTLGYHMDHVIPVSAGGENIDSNIQLLCPSCNHSKGAKHPVDFMQSRGFLL